MSASNICQHNLRNKEPNRKIAKQCWQSDGSDKVTAFRVIPSCKKWNACCRAAVERNCCHGIVTTSNAPITKAMNVVAATAAKVCQSSIRAEYK